MRPSKFCLVLHRSLIREIPRKSLILGFIDVSSGWFHNKLIFQQLRPFDKLASLKVPEESKILHNLRDLHSELLVYRLYIFRGWPIVSSPILIGDSGKLGFISPCKNWVCGIKVSSSFTLTPPSFIIAQIERSRC